MIPITPPPPPPYLHATLKIAILMNGEELVYLLIYFKNVVKNVQVIYCYFSFDVFT